MKKYFLFAAVAGMLASCSSESLTGSDPKIEPTTQEDLVPIEINVANGVSSKAITRGEGTIGGTTDGTNKWSNQKVNVFMFKKGTLNIAYELQADGTDDTTKPLYDNTVMTTPNDLTKGQAFEYTDATHIQHRYYPIKGNYDFWGYFIDDAANGAISGYGDTGEILAPFIIDGTQDLMAAKSAPDPTADATAIADIDADDKNDDTKVNPSAGRDHSTRYYSAFAARRNLQPNLTFQHLLTRLTFNVIGGNAATCGWTGTPGAMVAPGTGTTYKGVFVKSITIKSKTTGSIVAAYTDPSTHQYAKNLIKFDDTPVADLELTSASKYSAAEATAASDPTLEGKVKPLIESAITVADLKIDGAGWSKIIHPTATAENAFDLVPVGGALLVAPADTYDMTIVLGQYLLDLEDTTDPTASTYVVKEFTVPVTGIAPAADSVDPEDSHKTFLPGYSYQIDITVYGAEEIKINTTLSKWETSATAVEIDAE